MILLNILEILKNTIILYLFVLLVCKFLRMNIKTIASMIKLKHIIGALFIYLLAFITTLF